MATSAPSTAAVSAAVRPAPPVPSTITSTSCAQLVTAPVLSVWGTSSGEKYGQFFSGGDDGLPAPLDDVLAVRDQVDARRRRGWQPVHRDREAVGVGLHL